jgi:hypothetical protein
MPSLLIRTACLAGLLVTAGIAIGAEPENAPARYEVELILFRHIDQSRNTPEIPAASSIFNPSPLDLTLAEIPSQPPVEPSTGNPLIIDAGPHIRRPPISFHISDLDPSYPDFVPLREDTHTLMRTYQRLEKIDAYEPLLHIGWIQTAWSTDDSRPYRFEPPATDGIGISGTVTLYKERFLHIEVDLALETVKQPVRTPFFIGSGSGDSPDVFKLTESRRIRGTTTHYFDSPQFGLITRIQEVRAAAAEREGAG